MEYLNAHLNLYYDSFKKHIHPKDDAMRFDDGNLELNFSISDYIL